ncbi:MAG: D-alanyl-D-alanine carboxypeptidase/D-alanyl-D-alanine-endopeptidase [Sterolibacterium sp.]|nr:D-alanyl-D-alanine carboxypeptidase/D-alanyl-D-alanine-endopeptidase [Sterolibacterium sp.]
MLLVLTLSSEPRIAHAEYLERLPAPVALALQQASVPPTAAAVIVQEVTAVQPLVSLNTSRPFNPASVMKLLTTYAALEILGPAYTWQTQALSSARPHHGVLAADLVLKGSGDPQLTLEQFWLLLRQLRAHGVREIHGHLLLDRSLFALPEESDTTSQAPFDDQPLRPYNVTPDALLVNFKSLRLQLMGDIAGGSLSISAEPHPAHLDIINKIRPLTTEQPCNHWKEALRATLSTHQGRHQLTLSGDYPLACGEKNWYLSVLTHPQYVEGVFKQLWQELGGTLVDPPVTALPSLPLAPLQTLASIQSPTLAEIIRDTNKYSNNVMARQLFLTLATQPSGSDERTSPAPLTELAAATRLRAWLQQKQLTFPELILDNGSGLSRHERISASSLAHLLSLAWKSPLMPEFVASLPLVATDGTMKKRLQQTRVAGQAHIKTGTLEEVKTMAGYVLDHRGHWQIVVFLVNHPNAAATQAAQDALLQWVYQH